MKCSSDCTNWRCHCLHTRWNSTFLLAGFGCRAVRCCFQGSFSALSVQFHSRSTSVNSEATFFFFFLSLLTQTAPSCLLYLTTIWGWFSGLLGGSGETREKERKRERERKKKQTPLEAETLEKPQKWRRPGWRRVHTPRVTPTYSNWSSLIPHNYSVDPAVNHNQLFETKCQWSEM